MTFAREETTYPQLCRSASTHRSTTSRPARMTSSTIAVNCVSQHYCTLRYVWARRGGRVRARVGVCVRKRGGEGRGGGT